MVVTKHPRRGRPEKRLLLFTGTRFCILKKAAEKVTHKTKGWSVGDKGWRGVVRGSDSEVRHCSPVVSPINRADSITSTSLSSQSSSTSNLNCVYTSRSSHSSLTNSLTKFLSLHVSLHGKTLSTPQVFHTTSKKYKLELDGDCCLVASLQVLVYRWYSV